jgi:glycosyltransferase involved in cell wall biosynthesis
MHTQQHKILVINHSGHPGGATISLYNLLHYTKQLFNDIIIDIVHLDNGQRVKEFNSLSDEPYFPIQQGRVQRNINRFMKHFCGYVSYNVKLPDTLLKKIQNKEYECIFVNTVIGLPMVPEWLRLDIPILCWVHELEKVCFQLFGNDTNRLLSLPITYIACSDPVDDFLTRVNPGRKRVVLPECIQCDYFMSERRALKPTNSILSVGMIGTVSHRKGYDLFVKVVTALRNHQRPIQFQWIGYDTGESCQDFIQNIENLGLASRIQLIPYQENSIEVINKLDVLLLTSREDPNPLVVLEAVASGVVPIVQRSTGGAVKIAELTDGVVVDYESIEQMVSAISILSEDFVDLNRRSTAGQNYAAKHLHPFEVVRTFRTLIFLPDNL